jgi:transcriptional antiterminator
MEFFIKIQRIEKLKLWVISQRCGSPDDFAKQLGVSCRTLRRWIQVIEVELNVEIDYDRTQQCYTIVSDYRTPMKK